MAAMTLSGKEGVMAQLPHQRVC